MVVVLVTFLQTTQDGDGGILVRLADEHGLETAFEGLVLLEILLIFVEGGGSDGAQFATGQRRLQDVGRIHRALAGRTGTDQRVDLINEKDDLAVGLDDLLDDAFQTLLELALVLGAGHQSTHIQRVQLLGFQVLRNIAADKAVGEAFRNGGLADARFADQNRVVLGTARQDLQHPPDLLVTADDWVELALTGGFVEVGGVLVEGVVGVLAVRAGHLRPAPQALDGLLGALLRHAGVLQYPRRVVAGHQDAVEEVLE